MHPLLILWILVLAVSTLLGGVFYLADHYAHIIGNFYVLLSIILCGYGIYSFFSWMNKRKNQKIGH